MVDGALTLVEPAKADDIITTGKYANFDLQFDWKISKNGNSGVYYHVIEAGDYGYESGPEYLLLDNAHGEPPLQRAAGLFGLYAPSQDVTKPVGEFNHSRLVVDHGHCATLAEQGEGGRIRDQFARLQSPRSPEPSSRAGRSSPRRMSAISAFRITRASVAFRDIKVKPLD